MEPLGSSRMAFRASDRKPKVSATKRRAALNVFFFFQRYSTGVLHNLIGNPKSALARPIMRRIKKKNEDKNPLVTCKTLNENTRRRNC